MSFWRNVGYFWAVIFVIVGFILFPAGLILSAIGFIFIWMLKRSASQERIERYLKEMRDNQETLQQRKIRLAQAHDRSSDHCANCNKLMLFGFDTNPLCGQCQKLELR